MNYIDIIALVVVALGLILGVLIGFRKKAFNTLVVLVAMAASLWVSFAFLDMVLSTDWYQSFMLETLQNEVLGKWIAFLALYIVSSLVLSLVLWLITLPLSHLLTDSNGVLSHLLGGFNGLLFSFSLVVVALVIIASIPSLKDSIEGLNESGSFSLSLSIYDYLSRLFGETHV